MKLLVIIFILYEVNKSKSLDIQTNCPFPEDIEASRQSRIHHPCESNQIPQFSIEIYENFYCIFYSTSAIFLFGAETKFQFKIDGNWSNEFSGAVDFEIQNKTITFKATETDVTVMIVNEGDKMPRIQSVIVEDGALPDSIPQELCTCENCGIVNEAAGIIIGGTDARDGYWPWNVAIYLRQNSSLINFRCGATIINHRTLITTATCMMIEKIQIPSEKLIVTVRETSLFSLAAKKLAIKEIKIHENFTTDESIKNKLRYDFNVALLITTKDIQFTPQVYSICLPNSFNYDFRNRKGFVVGWGMNENYQMSENLKQLEIQTFPFLECFYRNRNFFSGFSSKRHFCGGFKNDKGICFGDAGGGFYIKNDKKFSLYGLSGFSNCNCNQTSMTCQSRDEGIFINIVSYLQWIYNNKY
jgi:hypothetical protein